MKKLIDRLFLVTCVIAMSCDNSDPELQVSTEHLPTKFIENGVMHLELIFDTERILIRANYFANGKLSGYYICEYDDEVLVELRRYNDEGTLQARVGFTLDNFGRIEKGEYYSSTSGFQAVVATNIMNYNASGQLIKRQNYAGGAITFREEYKYDPDGHLIERERTLYPSQPAEYVVGKDEYTPGEQPLYSKWNNLVVLMIFFDADEFLHEMFYVSNHHRTWSGDGDLVGYARTDSENRQFNTDGYLASQTLIKENLVTPGNNSVSEMTYEYLK